MPRNQAGRMTAPNSALPIPSFPLRRKGRPHMTKEGVQSPAVAIAILLVGIGLFAFFAVLLRLA
ncbi:MAG TPA: hypothetical protein VMS01_17175 [Stellaceae bacterium]|jgi:hypothetical protein|nr:hypothetical protein [Stellaceae bacterium]